MSNQLRPAEPRKLSFSQTIMGAGYQKMIAAALTDPKARGRFVAGITSAVAQTPTLQDCDPASILSCAFLGESLGLSPSPQLGQYYIVPYTKKGKYDPATREREPDIKVAQFQIGYRGLVNLALRTGEYKRINVFSVKEGEFISWNPLTEELQVEIADDNLDREDLPTVGYAGTFELLNGFTKTVYWSKAKMVNHADRYSQAFSKEATSGKYPKVSFADYEAGKYPKNDAWLYSSPWYTDFDAMAHKTIIRHIISKWGVMSVDLQKAVAEDIQAEIEVAASGPAAPVYDDPPRPAYVEAAPEPEHEQEAPAIPAPAPVQEVAIKRAVRQTTFNDLDP